MSSRLLTHAGRQPLRPTLRCAHRGPLHPGHYGTGLPRPSMRCTARAVFASLTRSAPPRASKAAPRGRCYAPAACHVLCGRRRAARCGFARRRRLTRRRAGRSERARLARVAPSGEPRLDKKGSPRPPDDHDAARRSVTPLCSLALTGGPGLLRQSASQAWRRGTKRILCVRPSTRSGTRLLRAHAAPPRRGPLRVSHKIEFCSLRSHGARGEEPPSPRKRGVCPLGLLAPGGGQPVGRAFARLRRFGVLARASALRGTASGGSLAAPLRQASRREDPARCLRGRSADGDGRWEGERFFV